MISDERYKELMVQVGMPNSRSLLSALQQVASEVEQACTERNCSQYEGIFEEVSKVYYHITEGRLSKPNTDSIYIIQAHDDQINALEEKIEQQAAEIAALREIAQYFYVSKLVSLPMYFELNIIDEDGNPTKLLTGK